MTDDKWFLEKVVAHERELGRAEARQTAAEAAISRIADEMHEGLAKLESAHTAGLNHLRGEIKAAAEQSEQQRKADMEAIGAAIDEVKQERADFRRSLSRVGWAIIAAVVAAAAAQTALSPQVAGFARQALEQLP